MVAEFVDDRRRLGLGGCPGLLGMDRLEHVADLADLARRHVAEDIAVEMHDAALPPGIGQKLVDALDQPPAGVRGNQLDALQPAVDKVTEERRPVGLVLLGGLADAYDLAETLGMTPIATSSETLRTSPAQVRFMKMPSRNT
jgi:hypothetical protein